MGVDIEERLEGWVETDDDEPIYSHYIQRSSSGESAAARIYRAIIEGTPVTALCGKVWIPFRDPGKYPICPKCKELVEFARDLLT